MKSLAILAAGTLIAGSTAFAQTMSDANKPTMSDANKPTMSDANTPMTTIPANSMTAADWYKQDVYDPNNNKIGQISDVLVSRDGHVNALIVGVGGFLGMGQKDVAVEFDAVKQTIRDSRVHLTMNTTKDALKSAPGFKYDSNTTTWVPDTASKRMGTD